MSAVIVIAIRETGAGIAMKNNMILSAATKNEEECAQVVSSTLELVLRGVYIADEDKEKKEGGVP